MKLARICAVLMVLVWTATAASTDYSATLKAGKPDLKSAGVMAFGPDGILFVGDPLGASIFAFDTQDRTPASARSVEIQGINEKIAALLGTAPDQILINDMVVNPLSKKTYLSVSRGRGPGATPVILRVSSSGQLEEFSLDNVKFSKAAIPNAPDDTKDARGQSKRLEAITDIAYVDSRVLVAGLSNEEFASNLRAIPFPFSQVDKGTSVEIYHGSHGRFETNAPVRTFVPYAIKAEPHILAAYTCTPLVKFPVSALKPGTKVMGTTIAELGNRNRPLDMIVYQKGGKDYLLLANSSRGVMKVSTDKIEAAENIAEPVKDGSTRGLAYETVKGWTGVDQLDRLDQDTALVLRHSEGSVQNLESLPLP